MSSLNTQTLSKISTLQIIDNFITVQTAAEITGYNPQYLRRLLRAGKLEAIKIGQIWLISLASMDTYWLIHSKTDDRRCGPQNGSVYTNVNGSRLRLYTEEDSNECTDS